MRHAEPVRKGAPPRKQAEPIFQSDLAMNLFMVLIVTLATLTTATVAITAVGFKVQMTSEPAPDAQPPLGFVRSWAPVSPTSPRLVVRDGAVQRLKFDDLAESFAAGRPFLPTLNFSKRPDGDPDPAALIVDFVLLNEAIPDQLIAWQIPGAALAETAGNEVAVEPLRNDILAFHRFYVVVFPGQDELAWDLLVRLRRSNKIYRVAFVSDDKRLDFERSSKRFTFDEMYR